MGNYGFESMGYGITAKDILSKISEEMLWNHYISTDFKFGTTISAPYRTDPTPSFNIFYSSRLDKILGKDFGGDGWYGDIFALVGKMYNLTFYESLVKINIDFNLGFPYDKDVTKNMSSNVISKESLGRLSKKTIGLESKQIQITERMFSEEDLTWWGRYGITKTTLRMYNVHAASRLFLNKELIYTYTENDPCYAYYFPKSKHFKCYFPLSRKRRFLGNINNFQDIQGYYQCDVKSPRDDKFLILTKSMKDCMTLREFGIDAMAIHGETQRFHPDFIRHITHYYPVVVSLYDRDGSGIKGAAYLWKEYGIAPYLINKRYRVKDISDMYLTHGKGSVDSFLDEIRTKIKPTDKLSRYA